jgi:ABC-type transport system involved in multi-copper enzyme maturation permease subunit
MVARLSRLRLYRSRLSRAAPALALLPPALVALVAGKSAVTWSQVFQVEMLLALLLPAAAVAPAIGEEIADRSCSYLWTRPVPRWTILAGVQGGLVPPLCALIIASWAGCYLQMPGARPALLVPAGLGWLLGGLAAGSVSAAMAALVPRHALAVALVYLAVLDLPLGLLPFGLAHLAVSHHVRSLVEGNGLVAPLLWLIALATGWQALALWRYRRRSL